MCRIAGRSKRGLLAGDKVRSYHHVFAQIEIEQRSAGTYGVMELGQELAPIGCLAMEAGLGISEWFAKCQDEYLSKKREEDKEMFTIGSTSGCRSSSFYDQRPLLLQSWGSDGGGAKILRGPGGS
jgi:hypothetical protein